LILHKKEKGRIDENEVLDYLLKRKNMLDGIVISGGEPTIQKGLIDFIKKVKKIGLKVKLDTNGSNPMVLKELLDENLVDYVAMDIKHSLKDYEVVTKCKVKEKDLKESIKLLKESKIDFEFRTTLIKNYHTVEDIKEILKLVGDSKYYIQNFKLSEDVPDKNLFGFTESELKEIKEIFKDEKNVEIRGL
jgi:pyruvate formate lyase activating enzyme